MKSKELKDFIVEQIKEKKGENIVVMDLRKVTSITDYFVICSGTVEQHIKAIKDNIIEKLSEKGINYWHIEGELAHTWVLIDYVDVVVHIFHPSARDYYKLEKLWADAKQERVKTDYETIEVEK
ncbi:MAG: ribosome silencing factor [Ignavibacteria bacterium]|nr:ribosome silencing factor [Ignavibacteria bacterium]